MILRDAPRFGCLSIVVLLLASLTGKLAAQTVFSEPFDYSPPGADLLGQDGGSGFAGPWFTSGFNASIHDNCDVSAGSLSFQELAVTGNRMSSASTNAIAGLGRNLAVPIAAGATTTAYFSFLLRPEGTLGQGAFNGFFGVYLDGTGNSDLFAGKPGSAVAGPYVIENRGGAGQVPSAVAPVAGETVLLVVRAELQPGADVFTLFVNPDPCQPEPASGTVKSDLDLGDVTAVVIYSTGAFSLDELRMGPSFEGVVRAGDGVCIPSGAQIPGDCNKDGKVDISDPVCLLGFLFLGNPRVLPCDAPEDTPPSRASIQLMDCNGNGGVDLSDAVWSLQFQFAGGPPPVLGTECRDIVGCPIGPACSP